MCKGQRTDFRAARGGGGDREGTQVSRNKARVVESQGNWASFNSKSRELGVIYTEICSKTPCELMHFKLDWGGDITRVLYSPGREAGDGGVSGLGYRVWEAGKRERDRR